MFVQLKNRENHTHVVWFYFKGNAGKTQETLSLKLNKIHEDFLHLLEMEIRSCVYVKL